MTGPQEYRFRWQPAVWDEPLPVPPAGWGRRWTFEMNAMVDGIELTLWSDDETESVRFWQQGDEPYNSAYYAESTLSLDEDEVEALVDYGTALQQRLDVDAWTAGAAALDAVRPTIIAAYRTAEVPAGQADREKGWEF
jgi:hypothetical protein